MKTIVIDKYNFLSITITLNQIQIQNKDGTKRGNLILIVGLACSGKTTLAHKIAEKNGYVVIRSDDLRYADSKWTRLPLADYKNRVLEAINSELDKGQTVVFESSLLDINDSENAREIVLKSLLPDAHTVLIIEPEEFFICLGNLIDRCIGRAMGTEPSGSCPETTMSRARLVTKFIKGYDVSAGALATFRDVAEKKGCNVMFSPRDKFYEKYDLLF